MTIRENLLEGKLPYPGSKIFEIYPEMKKDIHRFWNAIWFNYLNNADTNGLYWYEELGQEVFNDVIRRCSANGWLECHAIPARKWCSVRLLEDKLLEYVDSEELELIKAEYKYEKYVPKFKESTEFKTVKQNGQRKVTGLERKGFMQAGNTEFGYDAEMLKKYQEPIRRNLVKSMEKMRQQYPDMRIESNSYDKVAEGIQQWHIDNPLETFTTGNSYIDGRGRAISECLATVTNPIGNKDFRSLLIITY